MRYTERTKMDEMEAARLEVEEEKWYGSDYRSELYSSDLADVELGEDYETWLDSLKDAEAELFDVYTEPEMDSEFGELRF